ncbi:hypothetical protein vseg_019607 [Gypsophila vaccaria]
MIESSLSFAIQHIKSITKDGFNASASVKSEANALVKELKNIKDLLLNDERRMGLSTSHEVRRLLGELRSIAYKAEDEVDTVVLENSALPNYFRFRDIKALKKLRSLNMRAKEIKSNLDQHFGGSDGSNKGTTSPARGSNSPKGHLPADDDVVIGIDHEITKVVDLLTRKSNIGQTQVDRLAIVGMGGSGKTTLARSIFSHRVVKKHYQFQAWVSVSQGWDTSHLLHNILKQIRGQKSRFSSLFSLPWNDEELEDEPNMLLVSQLDKLLYQKNFLLVLDDVWDFQSLHEFITLIQGDDSNSQTIIITSRQTPSSDNFEWYVHQPQPLTDEKCWELFSKVASSSAKPLTDDYRGLAMEMLVRCQGLPLAIVALARLLKTKMSMHEWQRVQSRITGADATSIYGPVNEILGLSYDQLPYYLKPCFLYLGLFPEDSAISGGRLIRMWIAEGFVEASTEETLEVTGRRYLQELIDHTMVQVVRKTYADKAKTIRIHDIMRDFCISRARDLEFLAVSGIGPEAIIGKTSRRGAVDLSKTLILPTDNAQLRTLSLYEKSSTRGVPERYSSQMNHRYLNLAEVCQMYRLLRVLDIFKINSIDGTLPQEIGNLIHLTYLRIRSTNIRQLPKSIGKLRNLLTLDYWDVLADSEVQVPNVLWKLKKLRRLYLPNEMSGSVNALKLHTLKDLITLWGVGGGKWMLKDMGRMSSTLGKLYIHRISEKDQFKAALDYATMKENKNLYALALDWYGFEIQSLDALASKQNLKKLRLIGKAPDKSFSQGCQFPSNLGKLELYYTQLEKPETMTHLGKLVGLKVLRLSKDSYIGSEWRCDTEAFPVLEELKLTNLQKLEEWKIEKGALQRLKKLSIISCNKLKRIPEGLALVQSLEKLDIERMPSSFVAKLQKVKEWNDKTREGEEYHIIKHIPRVVIRDSCAP